MQSLIHQIHYSATWPIRHRVMWPERELDYVKIDGDQSALHFGIIDNGTLVSIVSLFIKGDRAQFRKLATLPSEQGKGYATFLLQHLIKVSIEKSIKCLWCNARVSKLGFYKKLGFEPAEITFSKGGQDYVIVELKF